MEFYTAAAKIHSTVPNNQMKVTIQRTFLNHYLDEASNFSNTSLIDFLDKM